MRSTGQACAGKAPERHAAHAGQLGSCRVFNLKPGRVGGLTHLKRIHDVALDMGIDCWIGGMLESAIGSFTCLAAATLPGCTYPADIFPTSRFYQRDLAAPELPIGVGPDPWTVPAPVVPGCPAAPDPDLLEAWTVRAALVERTAAGRAAATVGEPRAAQFGTTPLR